MGTCEYCKLYQFVIETALILTWLSTNVSWEAADQALELLVSNWDPRMELDVVAFEE